MSLLLFLFLCFTVFIPFLRFAFTDATKGNYFDVKVIAHRGAAGLAPENTMAAFQKALDIGVDIIELDVHLSKDNTIIVMHDNQVNRTTNGSGYIGDLEYAAIQKLDAGSWFGKQYKNEKIPTLDDVIKLVNGKSKLLIELKWPEKGIYSGLVEKIVQVIHNNDASSWIILQSFDPLYLREAASQAPDIECHQLIFGRSSFLPIYFDRTLRFGKFIPEPNAKSINLFYMYANKSFVKEMNGKGLSVYTFTADSENQIVKSLSNGSNGIITNYPSLAQDILKGKSLD